MSAVAERARSLARIAAVQADLVKLAEARLGSVRARREVLESSRQRLAVLVGGETPLGDRLARAALRSAAALDADIATATAEIGVLEEQMRAVRQREKAVTTLADEAHAEARRAVDAATLRETVEAWLARASLP